MANIIKDFVIEESTTTGTGSITVSGAINNMRTFSSVCSTGDDVRFIIKGVDSFGVPTGEWEVVQGKYSAANTLTRVTVIASSNADSLVNFSSGTKQVYLGSDATMLSWVREKLTANRTYYVRTDGSDSNNGLANTSGGAFLTIQKAIDVVSETIDLSVYNVTIQVADGTYTTAVAAKSYVGAGQIIINGNSGTPTNVVINTTSAACFTNTCGRLYVLKYMQLKTTTSGNCVYCGIGSITHIYNLDFGAAPSSAHMYVEQGGKVQAQATYTISGAASYHYICAQQGEIRVTGSSWTVTVTGSPAFTIFALAQDLGFIHHTSVTFSGTVTGKRYESNSNSVIKTYGGGASYFPGNSAGSTATGGQYA